MIDNESEPGSWAQHLEFNGMTDTPPDWVLIEAAKRSNFYDDLDFTRRNYGVLSSAFRALCDMILKHEQPPVDRKLLCAREAWREWMDQDDRLGEDVVGIRAIELYLEGYGE